jgi:hypothetical protein
MDMFARALLVEQYISFTHFCVPSYGDSQIKSWHRELPLKKKKKKKEKRVISVPFLQICTYRCSKSYFQRLWTDFFAGKRLTN